MKWGNLIAALAALHICAAAQLPYPDPYKSIENGLRGKPAVDLLPGARTGLGYPLRYGKIVKGSVRVELGGRSLREGDDFAVDYASGVLYLNAPVRESDSIRVSYRHDPNDTTATNGGALPMLTLNFGVNSSMTMLLGLGGAERFADGRVMQSQNLGMKNNFSFGKAQMRGLFLVSSQANARVRADGASPDSAETASGTEGTDLLIMQQVGVTLGGGVSFSVDYQNVGKKFGAFGMLAGNGIEATKATQLEKEKGIARFGFGINSDNPSGISLLNNFKTIADGGGKIQFHNYGIKSKQLELYYNARTIDTSFSRFADIAEQEREQLQKERGIQRQGFGGAFRFAEGILKFDRNNILQGTGGGIRRQSLAYDGARFKAGFLSQGIDQGFTRAADLAENERTQWAKERGFDRKDIYLLIPKDKDNSLLSFMQKSVKFNNQTFDASSFSFAGKNLSLDYWNRTSSPGFVRIGDLSGEEISGYAQNVLRMYDASANVSDNDRSSFAREAGLQRRFIRLAAQPNQKTRLKLENIGIKDGARGLKNSSLGFSNGNLNFSYRQLKIGSDFNRLADLLETERKFYGNQVGFDRTDWSLDGKLSPKLDFAVTNFAVTDGRSGAGRLTAMLKGKGFEFQSAIRHVDNDFKRTGDINDSEKDFFGQLVGYLQYDVRLKFDALKNFKIDTSLYDSNKGNAELRRFKKLTDVTYTPDSRTELRFRLNDHRLDGFGGAVFADSLLSFSGVRDFGKLGKFTALREQERFGGSQAGSPSRQTNYLKYETKLMKNADFTAEQSQSKFSDGGYENVGSVKLGWQLNPRLKLSFGVNAIMRDGAKENARASNFGFSYDFGRNLRLGYTFGRDVNSLLGTKHETNWELSEGQIGGFTLGGNFNEKGKDGEANTSLGKFTISNPKPFKLGFLKDVKIAFGYDGQTRVGQWERQNEMGQVSATVLNSEIGIGYTHLLSDGQLVADRAFSFKLDPTNKRAFQFNTVYKVRTLPNRVNAIIRNYDIRYKLNDRFNLTHTVEDLPEQRDGGAAFGSTLQPTMTRNWAVDFTPNKFASYKFAFHELGNIRDQTLARKADVTLSLFNNTDSPVKLIYGMEQDDNPAAGRKTRQLFQLQFDQKPGVNQTLSLIMGTVVWDGKLAEGQLSHNFLLNLDYQLRF